MPRRRWATPNLLNKPQSIGGGPERRRALAVPDWRSHPLGSACYPKTNQPATASRGTIATATSSKGAGSFPVLSVGLSSGMEHKARHVFLVPMPGSDTSIGWRSKAIFNKRLHWSQDKCSLNLLPDRNGWAGWQFSVCPQRGHWYRLLWPRRTSPQAAGHFLLWTLRRPAADQFIQGTVERKLSKGTGRI
jgi:hypothetical protein